MELLNEPLRVFGKLLTVVMRRTVAVVSICKPALQLLGRQQSMQRRVPENLLTDKPIYLRRGTRVSLECLSKQFSRRFQR